MGARPIDVAVLGGGPAGCAAALALRANFPTLSVVLVEAGEYTGHRPGEVLPPAARSLLHRLGVLHLLHERLAASSRGVVFAWGSPCLEESDYFFSAAGGGWHLNRGQFDAMLADAGERRGVSVLREAPVHQGARDKHVWRLLAGGAPLAASFVIDATGRSAAFARMQGASVHFHDTLTSYSRIFASTSIARTETVIESAPHGWWYTAPLPEGRRMVSFLTDADLGRAQHLTKTAQWSSLLEHTIHIAPKIAGHEVITDCIVRPASTARLSHTSGEGWLAAGDASAAYDPLSARGITSALRNGMLAAYAAGDTLLGRNPGAGERYSGILHAQFGDYQRAHRANFARETRWSDSPFWMRRHTALVPGSPGPPS
jgi:flavin-dependent dehydrogenase